MLDHYRVSSISLDVDLVGIGGRRGFRTGALTFSYSGQYLYAANGEGAVFLVNPNTQNVIQTLKGGHSNAVTKVKGVPTLDSQIKSNQDQIVNDGASGKDSGQLVTAGLDRRLILWDIINGKQISQIRFNESKINDICFFSTSTIISATHDAKIILSDIRTGKCLEKIGNNSNINLMRSNSLNTDNNRIHVPLMFSDSVQGIAMKNEYVVVTTCLDGAIRQLDLRMGKIICDIIPVQIKGNDKLIPSLNSLSISMDHNYALVSDLNSTLHLVNISNDEITDGAKIIKRYNGHKNTSTYILSNFMFNDEFIISGTEYLLLNNNSNDDFGFYIWDINNPSIKQTIPLPSSVRNNNSFSKSSFISLSAVCPNNIVYSLTGKKQIAVGSPISNEIFIYEL